LTDFDLFYTIYRVSPNSLPIFSGIVPGFSTNQFFIFSKSKSPKVAV